ncbi:dynein axonemal assembly factor 4 [Archocentrus centrarchus]|uniref:dynein axonemal assembly factor 4 n=1 Tax=Archocentrus centrarchus TaxID=63155 RepID=UPI0011EA3331|nr:dynein assembly factor 4, axonemal [Archocentrus centrarchus]
MPLLVLDYSWTQTDSTLYISVPLKGTKAGKVDVISTDEYLKVHFPPYLFEAFFFEPVDDDRSAARIGNDCVVITLPKRTNKVWEHLMIPMDNKEKMKEIRQRALFKYHEKLSSDSIQKAMKIHAENKYALETVVKLEKQERDRIQKIKDAEQEKITAELAAWHFGQTEKVERDAQLKLQNQKVKSDQLRTETRRQKHGPSDQGKGKLDQRGNSCAKSKKTQDELPPPRLSRNIQVSFTPRVFPTALRESRLPEEEEWLRKQAEAWEAVNVDVGELKDLKEEERNPDWLKDKGDKCFAAGDYRGAVNAYTLAIRLNRKMPALYSNRAACHLKLKNLHKAIEDSSQALDLLTPPVPANAAARVRAFVRRGSAFCQLQVYPEGLQDYQAALKIDPNNESLLVDTQRIKDIIQGSAVNPGAQ